MSDRWTDSLSLYLDDDLDGPRRRELEAHLATCEECRAVLEDLRDVKAHARSLVDPPAPDDLWAGIASRIGPAGSTRGRTAPVVRLRPAPRGFALPWALAAGAALVVVSASAMWIALHATRRAETSPAPPPSAPSGGEQLASFDAVQVEGEIAQLQQALDRGRGRLDPQTIAVLEKNLAVIRQATEDAKRALEHDPANRDLQRYFASTVTSKLDLVRRASVMAGV